MGALGLGGQVCGKSVTKEGIYRPSSGTEALYIWMPSLLGGSEAAASRGRDGSDWDLSWELLLRTLWIFVLGTLWGHSQVPCAYYLRLHLASPLRKSLIRMGPEMGLSWVSQVQVQYSQHRDSK